jgi:hypothetical protein
MVNRKRLQSAWQALMDISLVPAVARLPLAVPTERRNVAARHALLARIHGEFEEMPGLSLTLDQAARLFGLHRDIVNRILGALIAGRVLRCRSDGQFILRGSH